MANALGVAQSSISAWESDSVEVPARAFVRWAQVTGVTLEWLAEGYNEETAPARAGSAIRASFVGISRIRNWCTPRDLNPEPTVLGSVPNTAEELFSLWDSLERSAVR